MGTWVFKVSKGGHDRSVNCSAEGKSAARRGAGVSVCVCAVPGEVSLRLDDRQTCTVESSGLCSLGFTAGRAETGGTVLQK